VAVHPELEAEQAHVDHAYRRVDAMRAVSTAMLKDAFGQGGGGTHQARNERDVMARTALYRLEQLELGRESLVFGRIDRDGGESFHIGRLAVWDEDQEPLVVDWRAPVVEPFYRATGRHPMGLTRRRHFLTEGRLVTGLEDELFGAAPAAGDGTRAGVETDGGLLAAEAVPGGSGDGTVESLGLSGPGALLAVLQRSRSGRMRDIVATVQAEQDEIIRAPLAGVLVVQGGPGTGKTAVALHRAAYLLYTHRFPLERQGVLVVAPNPLFLRYIEQVLPSLGESGAELSTVTGLRADVTVSGVDGGDTARLKGDPRMVPFLRHAVADRQRPLSKDLRVGFRAHTLRLPAATSSAIVTSVKRRPGNHNARRRQLEALVFRHLHREYQAAEERLRRAGLRADLEESRPPDSPVPEELEVKDLARALRRDQAVVAALDRMWPRLSPEQLLHDLFGAPALVRLAAGDLFTEAERARLHRSRAASVDDVSWTEADVPLLDEADVLLGPLRRRKGLDADEHDLRTYGHIVMDEAQDLSPMQLRMVGRRSLSGSMTVVGDVAQATGLWAPAAWSDVLAHLPTRRGARVTELSVNYRTPAETMEMAVRVLAVAAPAVRPPDSVRRGGAQPRLVRAAPTAVQALGPVVTEEQDAVPGGTVAVICPASLVRAAGAALAAAGIAYGEPHRDGLDAPVTVVAVELVKGLEFDSVVVVEPARLVRESAQGLRALYVALTRTTRRLTIVHAEPLPDVMG